MKTQLLSMLALLSVSAAWAQNSVPATPLIPAASPAEEKPEPNPAADATSIAGRIAAATKAHDLKTDAHMKKVRAEKDRKKMIELYMQRPQPINEVDMILKLAKETPKAEGIEQGLVWSLRTMDSAQRDAVTELLLTHYKDSKSIGRLATAMRYNQGILRRIINEAGDETVRQGATHILASQLISKEESKEDGIKLMKRLQLWPGLKKNNPSLFSKVKGDLLALEKLRVGSEAPDIVGTDHEGKEFKLSDYRGKVVLIDFWGIW